MTIATAAQRLERTVPLLGGFNLEFLIIEFKRRLRNRRTCSGCSRCYGQ